jgi:hypothetical protein
MVVDKLMNRKQLHRRHSEVLEVVNHSRVRHGGIGAADFFRDVRVQLRKSFDMHFIDDGLKERSLGWSVVLPIEVGVDHHGFGHESVIRTSVNCVVVVRIVKVVWIDFIAPYNVSIDGSGVRIDQEFVGIESVSTVRIVGTMHPESILRSRHDIRNPAMPDVMSTLKELDSARRRFGSVFENTDFDLFRVFRKESEIGAFTCPGGAQRVGETWPESNWI